MSSPCAAEEGAEAQGGADVEAHPGSLSQDVWDLSSSSRVQEEHKFTVANLTAFSDF